MDQGSRLSSSGWANDIKLTFIRLSTLGPDINCIRVANRYAQGGHSVPDDKIRSRYSRSIGQIKLALPHVSRAFVFDNSASEMDFLGEYEEDAGWIFSHPYDQLPRWFTSAIEED